MGVLFALGCAVSQGTPLISQIAPQARASGTCGQCRIIITPVLRFGQQSARKYLPADPYAVVRDALGRYIVGVPDHDAERLWVFDREGRFLTKFGFRGEGPGELLGISALTISPDGVLHAWDDRRGRVLTFDREFRFLGSNAAPRDLSAAIHLANGTTIVSAPLARFGEFTQLLHRLARDGSIQSSLGDSIRRDPRDPIASVRRLTPSHSGGFWSAPWTYRYRLEWWSRTGQRLRSLEPRSTWFTPYDHPAGATPDRPAQSSIYGLWESETGHVWVTALTADSGWREGLGPPVRLEGQQVWPTQDPAKVYDGMIEVFDPRSGSLMARRRVPEPFHFVIAPGLLGGVRWDEDGLPSIEVVRVSLRRN
jgi:hypothetical protein